MKLNRVSVVPSPLCGTLAPPDDITALVWHTLVTMWITHGTFALKDTEKIFFFFFKLQPLLANKKFHDSATKTLHAQDQLTLYHSCGPV